MDLAELHLLDVVQVAGGAQDDEQGVAVALQLGPLVGDDGVLDGQLVEAELLGHGQQLGLGRPVEPDPGHGAALVPQVPGRLGDGCGAVDPAAVPVGGRGDHTLLHRLGGGSRTRLHGDLGRRRLPLPVRATAEAETTVREQDTGTALGHGRLLSRTRGDAGTGGRTAHRHVPPGRRPRAPASAGTRRLAAHSGLTSCVLDVAQTRQAYRIPEPNYSR